MAFTLRNTGPNLLACGGLALQPGESAVFPGKPAREVRDVLYSALAYSEQLPFDFEGLVYVRITHVEAYAHATSGNRYLRIEAHVEEDDLPRYQFTWSVSVESDSRRFPQSLFDLLNATGNNLRARPNMTCDDIRNLLLLGRASVDIGFDEKAGRFVVRNAVSPRRDAEQRYAGTHRRPLAARVLQTSVHAAEAASSIAAVEAKARVRLTRAELEATEYGLLPIIDALLQQEVSPMDAKARLDLLDTKFAAQAPPGRVAPSVALREWALAYESVLLLEHAHGKPIDEDQPRFLVIAGLVRSSMSAPSPPVPGDRLTQYLNGCLKAAVALQDK